MDEHRTLLDVTRPDLTLGVVGTGLMGRGIAQIAAQGGVRVMLYDNRPGAATEAREALVQTFSALAAKGKLAVAAAEEAGARLQVASTLSDLGDCAIVIEAIVEDLEAKRQLFRDLEAVVSDACVLATNTSSLSVTSIASACRRPERVAGFHFFSPVPLMKLVEVIDGALTAPGLGDALTTLARRMGHAPVRARDTPGFIVNHAGRGYITESLRLLGEGVAEFATLDAILRDAVGFRLGPCELLDLTGLDVSQPVMESIYAQYYQEPRYRPSVLTRQRLAAGLLGRKSGRGFYTYRDGRAEAIELPPPPPPSATPVWISPQDPLARARVLALLAGRGLALDEGAFPRADSVCLVLPVGMDTTHALLAERLDPVRTLALDPLYLDRHLTLMTNPLTAPEFLTAAWGALASTGKPVSVIHDSPGFVAQRVVAMIVNIGCDIAQQRIATPDDIDCAVRVGLGYPQGPLALGDSLGASTVLRILDGLYGLYRDPRYRPSPWLTRRARLGVSLRTPENPPLMPQES